MKKGFRDLLDPSNDPEFFWQVISGPAVYLIISRYFHHDLSIPKELLTEKVLGEFILYFYNYKHRIVGV
jgi:hypothetical protein